MDPYPLQGWRWINEGGQKLLMHESGTKCETTVEACDFELATQGTGNSKDAGRRLSILQHFLNRCCSETIQVGGGDDCEIAQDSKIDRENVTTGPLEDYLWRGDDEILKDMPWYVYSMWVYRIEKPPKRIKQDVEPAKPWLRFIDIEFSPDYALHTTHLQRITTEFRVPLFEGFQMPPSIRDSETAAMYKSLLLREFSICLDETKDWKVRFAESFDAHCMEERGDANQAATKGETAAGSHCQRSLLMCKHRVLCFLADRTFCTRCPFRQRACWHNLRPANLALGCWRLFLLRFRLSPAPG